MQCHVHFLERSEKSGERMLQVRGTSPRLAEIARPELILPRNHGRSHGAIFVRPLRPRQFGFPVDPESKTQAPSRSRML